MIMAGRLVHLTPLFLGKLEQAVNQHFVHILSLVTDKHYMYHFCFEYIYELFYVQMIIIMSLIGFRHWVIPQPIVGCEGKSRQTPIMPTTQDQRSRAYFVRSILNA